MPDSLLGTEDPELQRTLDYLGRDVPVSLSTKPALPVGGAPAGAAAGPTSTGGGITPTGGPGGGGIGTTGGQGAVGGPDTGFLQTISDVTRGISALDLTRRLFDKFGGAGAPVSVGTSQILEGAPDTGFTAPTRGFTAPSPGFGGGTGAAESGGGTPGADQLTAGAGGTSALSNIANGIALVGPTLGMLPRWLQGQGGPPIGGDAFGAGASLIAGPLLNPLSLFGTVGAGLIGGILESAGVVGPGDYGPRREEFAQEVTGWAPMYADAIRMAQSPEELSYLLGPDSRGGAPWWFTDQEGGPGWNFNYDPGNTAQPVNVQGMILPQEIQGALNQYIGGLTTTQLDIIQAAQQGDPQAQAFLQNSMAERTRRTTDWRTQREQALADEATQLAFQQGGGP